MSRYASPLRYPGGKQRLAPFIRELLEANGLLGGEYVEPYAGGAGVAIELLLSGQITRAHLNDSSFPIFAFWSAILTRPEDFCRRISEASLCVEEWRRKKAILRSPSLHDPFEVGFSTFYLNRCNRSGVLSGGLIGGLEQSGTWLMDARFPRNELIRRIELIALERHRITISNQDAEDYISAMDGVLPDNSLIYCDPPYFEKSSGLYLDRYNKDDHSRLASFIGGLRHRWLVSYDAAPEILALYRSYRSFTYDLQYNAARTYKGREVFVFSSSMNMPSNSALAFIDHPLQELVKSAEFSKDLSLEPVPTAR